MRILGIDPGLNKTGWGVIDSEGSKISFVAAGTIVNSVKASMSVKLATLSSGIAEVVSGYNPDFAAIEETFLNSNPMSSLKLGHARGALIVTLANLNLPPFEYAATLVKKSLTGVGRAEKPQVMAMIKYLMPAANIKGFDAADALAVAICHCHHSKFNHY